MRTRLLKRGNSLAIRIPRSFATEAGLLNDGFVDISLVNGKIIIVPIEKPNVALKNLLTQVTADNLHHELNSGPAAGIETW